MKKKVLKSHTTSKKTAPKKKYKSYYIPVAERKDKVSKKTPNKAKVKKKYKSYYKSKKKTILGIPVVETPAIPVRELAQYGLTIQPEVKVSKRPVKYLNNKDLLAQVILSKTNGKMTNELAKMLQLLTMRYGKKGNWNGYTYNDDMQSYAMLMIVKTWQGFDPAKSSNPFAWFTQCIKNSFIQFLNSEKRQRDIRDEILVDSGMNPSFNYQYEYAAEDKGGEVPENENVELPTKPSHNDVTFEAPEEDDTPVEVLQY